MKSKGLIQVYTGNGKGKTTAAVGLSIRAAQAGKKVFFAQFVKAKNYNEAEFFETSVKNIDTERFGKDCFIFKKPKKEDKDAAQRGFKKTKDLVLSGKYDLIILDELNIALYYDLISLEDVLNLLKNKNEKIEVIITGRYAKQELIDIADLVTEMKEIKHYYRKGVEAREGFEF